MTYTREGSCNQCGECCKQVGIGTGLVDEKTGLCRYLEETDAKGVYICLITEGAFNADVERPEWVSESDYDYWRTECRPYPDPNDPAHCPPIHYLPESCGYKLIKVE